MAIDFTMPAHVHEIRHKGRAFIKEEIEPAEAAMQKSAAWRDGIIELRKKARQRGLWLPHMPPEFGGLGLDAIAIAVISAECGRTRLASFILNVQAPDEGNMHTMLHFATPAQKEKYLRPLCDGKIRSCFAMTEPEAAGSDPTQIKTSAVKQGDNWVINGHKWFISGAHGAKFAIVIAKTDPDAARATRRSSSICPTPDFESCAISTRWRAREITARSCSRIASCLPTRCSAPAARATRSGKCDSVPRASRIACEGSEVRKSRST